RRVSTVLQKEVVMAERRIFCLDRYAAEEFEMLVLSFCQKLNEERAGILDEGLASGRFVSA
ncbi:MAG: nucleotidyltransferase domain-containing protein, partial [Patescibacteria group bacterium]|nr:nucleotidyltransferase domain-containing protein [Patescibacteria group bacterium]